MYSAQIRSSRPSRQKQIPSSEPDLGGVEKRLNKVARAIYDVTGNDAGTILSPWTAPSFALSPLC